MASQSLNGHADGVRDGRFGNVFRQFGSVIPRFREQIARGGPVTVTHPEITRYFMSISEATQLLLQAGLMGKGGEILVLDMGDPVRIIDLARDMVRMSGADPDRIAIVFTGLRPGGKLYEEVLAEEEETLPTPHPRLRIAQAREANTDAIGQMVAWWSATAPPTTPRCARALPRGFRVRTACRRAGAADSRCRARRGACAAAAYPPREARLSRRPRERG